MNSYRYSHMVHEYYVRRLREEAAERRVVIDSLKTKADAEAYVAKVRRKVRKCFAPFPARTPLNPVVTGIQEYPAYRLEKVLFESRPGFLVTGNLYIPKKGKGPYPCVLGLCGHSATGKAAIPYQSFSQGLVHKGFLVFTIDPMSQGERFQQARNEKVRTNCCWSHNAMGKSMLLTDDFFGTWRVWDAIRGLDYLLWRPEADRTRVGVTGVSGGGTLTTYLTALDPRPTMAAPGCFISSYLANVENELPSDAEQNPPGILAAGLDQVDMLLCYAPRPTILLSQREDFFDPRASREAARQLKKIHTLLGHRDAAGFAEGPGPHGYFIEIREAMYKFFMHHAGLKGTAREKGVKPVSEQDLFVTPHGDILRAGSKTAWQLTAEKATDLARQRGKLSTAKMIQTAEKILNLPLVRDIPHYRCLRGCGGWTKNDPAGINIRNQFSVDTEPGIQVILTTCGPKEYSHAYPPRGHVRLFVGHSGGEADAGKIPAVRALTQDKKIPILLADPRGMGQSMSKTCGTKDLFAIYGNDYLYSSTGEMLAESYFGRRVFDILRTLDCLYANGATKIDLVGRGMGSLIVTFAALIHPARPRIRILNYLPSFEMLTRDPAPAWPMTVMPRGILQHFDLPDVYRVLGRRLTREKPWNSRMKPQA